MIQSEFGTSIPRLHSAARGRNQKCILECGGLAPLWPTYITQMEINVAFLKEHDFAPGRSRAA